MRLQSRRRELSVRVPSLDCSYPLRWNGARSAVSISQLRNSQPLFRSPWSNEYDPPLEDGTVPIPKLRKLEIAANEAFDTYREMYYEGGVSSVYLWDLEDGGFAGVVLLKKSALYRPI